MAKKHITSRPGFWGTIHYYDEIGRFVGKSCPGLLKGTRIYTDQCGRYVGKSHTGFLGEEVFTDTNHNHFTSYKGFVGNNHFRNGVPIGRTRRGFFGFEHTVLETEDELSEEEYFDRAYIEEDLNEDWDEIEAEAAYEAVYEDHTPAESRHTVIKNLQLFVLCIVICIVIACIYAIARSN